jgi:hypothetical protein
MLQRLATSDNKKGMNAGSLSTKPKIISKKATTTTAVIERTNPRVFIKACKHHNNGTMNLNKQVNPVCNGINTNKNPNGKKQGKNTRLATPFGLYARNKDALINTQMKYNPIGEVTHVASSSGLVQRKHNQIGTIKKAPPSKLFSRNHVGA